MADFSVDIDDSGRQWVCQIRPVWNTLTVSLLTRLLFAGGAVGFLSVSWCFEPFTAEDRVPYLVSLLIPCLLIGYLVWTTVCFVRWMRYGERMIVCAETVSLEKQPTRGETATFAVTELRDLQVRLVRPKAALIRGCLCFKTDVGAYTFGRGLNLRQAEELHSAVLKQLRKVNWTAQASR